MYHQNLDALYKTTLIDLDIIHTYTALGSITNARQQYVVVPESLQNLVMVWGLPAWYLLSIWKHVSTCTLNNSFETNEASKACNLVERESGADGT